jgi:hypothetical protein
MDCKRPYEYRSLKLLLFFVCLLTVTSCSWVPDDEDECPYGFWLRVHYTYNILDVEAAHRYVNDVIVYVYDKDGNYVTRIYAPHSELATNGYKIRIKGLPEGDYQFVVLSGATQAQYQISGDIQSLRAFRLSLAGSGLVSAAELPALFHGYLPTVHYGLAYAVHDVELTKNTNQLNCLIVSVDRNVTLDPADYAMKFVADNGVINAFNELATTDLTVYEPYSGGALEIDDPDYGTLHGLEYNISTLRLLEDRVCRVVLENKSTGQVIFNISFPEYMGIIGSFYTNLGRQLSVQEYLDRQDFYTVVFFLSDDLEQLIQLQVNSWRLRAYNHLKLE